MAVTHAVYHEQHVYCCVPVLSGTIQSEINPSRAIFVSRNIGIYLRFLSLLDTDMTQEAEIISYWRQGPTYFAESMSWWVDARSQGVSNNDIDYVQAE